MLSYRRLVFRYPTGKMRSKIKLNKLKFELLTDKIKYPNLKLGFNIKS